MTTFTAQQREGAATICSILAGDRMWPQWRRPRQEVPGPGVSHADCKREYGDNAMLLAAMAFDAAGGVHGADEIGEVYAEAECMIREGWSPEVAQ
jgi:hypothetical protein